MEENLRARLSLFADLEAKLEKLEKNVNVEMLAVEAAVVSSKEKEIEVVVAEEIEETTEEEATTEAEATTEEEEITEEDATEEETEDDDEEDEADDDEEEEEEEEEEELEAEPENLGETEEISLLSESTDEEQQNAKHKHSPPSILRELAGLFIKIAIIALTGIITFTFVFGFHRNTDPDMSPMVKAGDLVMYYRLDKNYSPGDLLVLDFDGELQVRRVIARAGDVVDIDDRGLKINNAWQQEQGIYQETWQYEEGIDFPLTVGPGQVFVLGDERENATDSRMYGAVDVENTRGTVVTIIRRRNF